MSQKFETFLISQGFIVSSRIIDNGEFHRFPHAQKPRSKSCWAMLFPGGKAGCWGDWRSGDATHYWDHQGREYSQISPQERAIVEEQRKLANERTEKLRIELAEQNVKDWHDIKDSGGLCDYLVRKKVGNYGLKIDPQGNAYCPARDLSGKIWNYQNISSDPKLFQSGRMSGCFHLIEGSREQIIIASGYATAASIHEATGLCVVACFGDSNVLAVAKILQDAKWKNLCVAADNDSDGSNSGNKIGQRAADELGLRSVIPDTPGDFNDLVCRGENIYKYFYQTTPVFSFGDFMADGSPMPEDIISPRVLTESGMLVFGGAPKVGKSDFMLSWLANMAAGLPFMRMTPPRPLRVFYLQSEVQYHYLRERIQAVDIPKESLGFVSKNLFITPQIRMLLDEEGVKTVGNTIRQCFGNEVPDIICIDPIANVYDQESENDNAQMMKFLSQRVESLRNYASEKTGFMLIHHTKKIAKDELAKDPFQMFSGASSLRRYYTTGMLMYRPDEMVSECVLTYEVRNGPRIKNINIDKDMGRWVVVDEANSRIAKAESNNKYNEERQRKVDTIIQEIRFMNSQNRPHTMRGFADSMAGKSGLGASRTISSLLSEMLAQNDIWLNNDKDRHLMA